MLWEVRAFSPSAGNASPEALTFSRASRRVPMPSASRSSSSYSYSYSRSRSGSPAAKTTAGKDKSVPDKERHQRRSSSSGSSKADRGPRRDKGEEAPKILHVSNLTRNVTTDHLREIFGNFGEVKTVELAIDTEVQLPKGYAFVEYGEKKEVDAAIKHMSGGQIDGQNVTVHIMGQTPKPPPAPPRGREPGRAPPPQPRYGGRDNNNHNNNNNNNNYNNRDRPMSNMDRRGPGRGQGPPPPPPPPPGGGRRRSPPRRDRSPPRRGARDRSRSPPPRSRRSPPPRRDDRRRDEPRRDEPRCASTGHPPSLRRPTHPAMPSSCSTLTRIRARTGARAPRRAAVGAARRRQATARLDPKLVSRQVNHIARACHTVRRVVMLPLESRCVRDGVQ